MEERLTADKPAPRYTCNSTFDQECFPWSIIDKYFNDNPNYLVAHHLDSYNSFF